MRTWGQIVREIDEIDNRMKRRHQNQMKILRELNAKGESKELDSKDIKKALDSLAKTVET